MPEKINPEDKKQLKVLYVACYEGNYTKVKQIFREGDIRVNDDNGEVLVWTIRGNGSEDDKQKILQCLKANGVSLNIRDNVALKWAIIKGNLGLIKFLEKEGVEISDAGSMMLFHAAKNYAANTNNSKKYYHF